MLSIQCVRCMSCVLVDSFRSHDVLNVTFSNLEYMFDTYLRMALNDANVFQLSLTLSPNVYEKGIRFLCKLQSFSLSALVETLILSF